MRLCEDTLAHTGTAPKATHRVAEHSAPTDDPKDISSHEYDVCTECMKYLTSDAWLNVKVIETISQVTVSRRAQSCDECGHEGTDVSLRAWYTPNRHDSGIVPVCDECWSGS